MNRTALATAGQSPRRMDGWMLMRNPSLKGNEHSVISVDSVDDSFISEEDNGRIGDHT